MSVDVVHTINDDFEQMVQDAVICGIGLMAMEFKDGVISSRVIPREEYMQLSEHLAYIANNIKDFK